MENFIEIIENPLVMFFVVLIAVTIVQELGLLTAVHSDINSDEKYHEQIVGTRDGLGVLLSLLLGFTLAMALPRYDLRRELQVDAANAIGTTALRAEMLPEPQRTAMRGLMVQYADARLDFSKAVLKGDEITKIQEQSKRLQLLMWQQAMAAAQASPNAITSIFIQSLNETIDLSEKRLAALENRIPMSIWVMLFLISLLMGFATGLSSRTRFHAVMLLTPLMIAIVMGLIADLDSPTTGFIQTETRSMHRIAQDLHGGGAQNAQPAPPANVPGASNPNSPR